VAVLPDIVAKTVTRSPAKVPFAKVPVKRQRAASVIDDPELIIAKKPRVKKTEGKENKKVVDVDVEDEFLAKGRVWSADDKTLFFEWLLGADSVVFDIHKTNPDKVFRKVSIKFYII
jgi:hypothetical protein